MAVELPRYGVRRNTKHVRQLGLRKTEGFQSNSVRRVVAHAGLSHRSEDQRNVDYRVAHRIDVAYNPVWLTGLDFAMSRKPTSENNFAVDHPSFADLWHPDKNGSLKPSCVLTGSSAKVWWLCSFGHEYQRSPYNQAKYKASCPFCSGRYATPETSLEAKHPEVSRQWHPCRNKDLLPANVLPLSNKSVWWVCDRGHEYKATVYHRTMGTGCPCCSGRKASEDDNLAVRFPQVAAEWHPTKNGMLTPSTVRHGSDYQAWWLCRKGHVFQCRVYLRSHGAKCPHCALEILRAEKSIAAMNPALASEWHPEKNGELTPDQVLTHSPTKIWWICESGHEYQAAPLSRRTTGCPFCAGWELAEGESLADLFPSISAEWHPTRNGDRLPSSVRPRSSENAWWICPNGHSFQCLVRNRTRLGVNCGVCCGRQIDGTNSIATAMPHILDQWDYDKNIGLDPAQIYFRNKTLGIWWKCAQGHSWKVNAGYRAKGSSCPHCVPKTSKMEIFAYCEVKNVFPSARWRAKVGGIEADILIPDIRVVVEVDGVYWHRDRADKDGEKSKRLQDLGFTVYRIREHGLPMLSARDVSCPLASCNATVIGLLFKKMLASKEIRGAKKARMLEYIGDDEQKNGLLFDEMVDSIKLGRALLPKASKQQNRKNDQCQ